ncbi:hypothetical protein HME7025_01913 [Aquirufa nivalisilvae]|uniref:Prenyltransferase n=1 Tax=Aquirufa nivalisilvae TaxID=2516557 RepID=A0A2S2DWN9_9BACT|nr:hypothetical protein [Aquirufa nivalisilvae]AWL09763.1 hypothetical protein HME7025_01913 [Aquirufa nivalisilvae]
MRFIKIAHLLSFDVVCGTLAFQALLHELFLKEMPSRSEQISLACAVWGIYLIDRMIDRKKGVLQDERHSFQSQYANLIKIIVFVLLLIGGLSLRVLDPSLIYFGLSLCFILLIYWVLWYFGAFSRIPFSKEFMTALIYTLGVGATTWYRIPTTQRTVILGTSLFLLVLQNLIMFNAWELEEYGDTNVGWPYWKYLLIGIEVLFLLLFIVVLFYLDEKITFVPFAITFAIQSWIHYFSKNKLASRIWGELAYCSPILYFAYEFFSK